MLSILKEIPSVGLYIVLWVLSAYWFKIKKYKMATGYLVIGFVLLLAISTSYIPKKLIFNMEKAYKPMVLNQLTRTTPYYIYVLGSGASKDSKLPAAMNLNTMTLTRLVEGIRIHTYLDHAILVTSAALKDSPKSQAQLSKETAVALGVNEARIEMLETATTTLEEAKDFKTRFGTNKTIILVTSALHMPRAVQIFKDQGMQVLPAPTAYVYKEDEYNGLAFPSFNSINLMNAYHITKLKEWYYLLVKKG